MLVLLVLFVFAACLVLVPLLLVGLALRLMFAVVLLPFRLAGLALRLAIVLAMGLLALLMAGSLLLVPLLPIAALIGAIWLLARLVRGRPTTAGLARS